MKNISIILQQVRNDLTYLKFGILILSALGGFYILTQLRQFNDFNAPDNQWSTVIWFCIIVLSSILIMLAVQKDSPINTRAFWLTRPISSSVMFISKMALVAVVSTILLTIYLLPPFISSTLNMTVTYTWDFAYRSLPFLVIGGLLGSIGKSFNESLIKAAFLFLIVVASIYYIRSIADPSGLHSYSMKMDASIIIASHAISLLGVIIFYIQFRARKAWLGLALSVGAILCWASIIFFLDLDAIKHITTPNIERQGEWKKTSIILSPKEADITSKNLGHNTQNFMDVRINGEISNIPTGLSLGNYYTNGKLSYNDTSKGPEELEAINERVYQNEDTSLGPYFVGYKRLGGYTFSQYLDSHKLERLLFFRLNDELFEQVQNKPLNCDATIHVEAVKKICIGKVPFGNGTIINKDNIRVRLSSEKATDKYNINMQLSAWTNNRNFHRQYKACWVVLVNSKEREVLLTHHTYLGPGTSGRIFKHSELSSTPIDKISEEWLKHTEIQIFLEKSLGYVPIPVKLKDYIIPLN